MYRGEAVEVLAQKAMQKAITHIRHLGETAELEYNSIMRYVLSVQAPATILQVDS
jgi:hypothetical protein